MCTKNDCVYINLLNIRHKIIKLQIIKEAKKIKLFSEFCKFKSYKNNFTTKQKEGTNTVIYAPELKEP